MSMLAQEAEHSSPSEKNFARGSPVTINRRLAPSPGGRALPKSMIKGQRSDGLWPFDLASKVPPRTIASRLAVIAMCLLATNRPNGG